VEVETNDISETEYGEVDIYRSTIEFYGVRAEKWDWFAIDRRWDFVAIFRQIWRIRVQFR